MRRLIPATLLVIAACSSHGKSAPPASLDLGPAPVLPVHRVVTLAPSLTEIFVAIGAADRIAGVTRFDDSPEVTNAARVGGYSDPETEAVMRIKPDVIVCQPTGASRGAVESLARGGIPVAVLPLTTLADVEAAITRIGTLTGLPDRATAETERLQSAREEARVGATHRSRKPRVAVLISLDPLIAAGPGSFIHEMLEDAGAEDAVEASVKPYPTITIESFVRRRPDAFLLALMPGEVHGPRPVLGVDAPAIDLKSEGFKHPGPRVAEAMRELTGILDKLAAPK